MTHKDTTLIRKHQFLLFFSPLNTSIYNDVIIIKPSNLWVLLNTNCNKMTTAAITEFKQFKDFHMMVFIKL